MAKEEQVKDNIDSNDQIVDNLIKDFSDSCQTNCESSDECKKNENIPLNSDAGSSRTVHGDELIDDSNEQEETRKVRPDYVDEEAMKEKELTYSDEDKETYKKLADEHKQKGNTHFKANEYQMSVDCYTLGLRTCPLVYTKERAILYANRAACKIKLSDDESALDDCTKAVDLDPTYVRALLRRAQLQESMDKLHESLDDFKKLLELDPSNKDAIMACQRLPPRIDEKNEQLKAEMFGTLKNLGNLFLRPFGISTENFKMVQDPNTGGYSVSFQQNQTS